MPPVDYYFHKKFIECEINFNSQHDIGHRDRSKYNSHNYRKSILWSCSICQPVLFF